MSRARGGAPPAVTPSAGATFEARLKAQALGLGFDLAGIVTLGPVDSAPMLDRWLEDGHHGEMDYLARGAALRRDTTLPEPGMRSALVVALDYGGREPSGPVARYARGDDYHRLMWDRLDEVLAWARDEWARDVASRDPGDSRVTSLRGRAYVDTGPILERDLARKAGLGWIGKNTMLLNPGIGSYFFLGALFLDADLVPDEPFAADHCGSCRRCLDACPTDAFVEPRVLDARRCISYLTIELRGEIPEGLREAIGEHLYGCDVCQDACPWNHKFARELRERAFAPRAAVSGKDARALAHELLAMTEADYAIAFKGSAMKRARLSGLRRNATAVLANGETAGDS
jgi:epoxyqueuosine reductase